MGHGYGIMTCELDKPFRDGEACGLFMHHWRHGFIFNSGNEMKVIC